MDPGRFLGVVLDKEKGLLKERVASLVSVFDPPGVDRVTMATDTYINSFPSIVEKVTITENVIKLAGVLGCFAEDRGALGHRAGQPRHPLHDGCGNPPKMAERRQFGDVTLEGPLDIDCAVSPGPPPARRPQLRHGHGDIYLMPNVEAGLLMAELTVFIGRTAMACALMGVSRPVVLNLPFVPVENRVTENRSCRPSRGGCDHGKDTPHPGHQRRLPRHQGRLLPRLGAARAGDPHLQRRRPCGMQGPPRPASLREAGLRAFIEKNQIDMGQVDLVISRGGLGRPAPAGAYAIDPAMCEDLMEGRYGKHPSALGPSMAIGPGAAIRNGRRCDRPAEHRRVPAPGTRLGPA